MEANPELQSIAVHQEVPKEEAVVEMIGAQKDRHLAIGRGRQQKTRTQGNGGSWKKLAAARGQLTSRTIHALRKGHGHQGPGKDNIVYGTPKG
jgi:hypothetical protein